MYSLVTTRRLYSVLILCISSNLNRTLYGLFSAQCLLVITFEWLQQVVCANACVCVCMSMEMSHIIDCQNDNLVPSHVDCPLDAHFIYATCHHKMLPRNGLNNLASDHCQINLIQRMNNAQYENNPSTPSAWQCRLYFHLLDYLLYSFLSLMVLAI